MVAGITGHQELSDDIKGWLNENLYNIIESKKVDHGYSSLAVGADQLFVKALISKCVPYSVVIPSLLYEETFKTHEDLAIYLQLKKEAEEIIVLDYTKPTENAFLEAGKRVVYYSDIIFAIWNGKIAKGLGGTADIVEYSKSLNKPVIHFHTIKKKVLFM